MRRRWVLTALALLLAVRSAASPVPAFALRANPFGYAGEYRDPTWGGMYLRARWYHPALPSFAGRDRAALQVNHYGYGGANPLMHVDPSGLSYRGAVGRPLEHFLRDLNAGDDGHAARIFLGQFLVPLQMVATPGAFWHAISHDTAGAAAFIAGGVLVEGLSYGAMYSSAARVALTRSGERLFWGRVTAETLLGAGQAATAGFSDHFHHFHSQTALSNLESILGPEVTYRLLIGIGYQPFNVTRRDIDRLLDDNPSTAVDQALVFRVRERSSVKGYRYVPTWTSPLQDRLNVGLFHGRVIAVSADTVFSTEYSFGVWFRSAQTLEQMTKAGSELSFEYVGTFDRQHSEQALRGNPANLATHEEVGHYVETGRWPVQRDPFDARSRNCQTHVRLVIDALGSR